MSNWGELSQYIQRGNADGRIVVIGDVHGCLHTLTHLIWKLNLDINKDTLVFLGDYVDRGMSPCETVRFIRNLQRSFPKGKCICLRGNHEQFMIDAEGQYDHLWDINGGFTTQNSYEREGVDPTSDIMWMDNLPLIYETDEYIFCHAGLPCENLMDNHPDDILWDRQWLKRPLPERDKMVVFGHTPNRDGARVFDNGDLCIDGGCVFGGKLIAAILDEDDIAIVEEPIHEKDMEGNMYCETIRRHAEKIELSDK